MTIQVLQDPQELAQMEWAQYESIIQDLLARPISPAAVDEWLKDWSLLSWMFLEQYNRLYVAYTVNTNDAAAEKNFLTFIDTIYPKISEADQALKEKLLQSGVQPEDFELPLLMIRTETELFRQENVPLLTDETRISKEYDKIIGAQTVQWQGKELTVTQLRPIYQQTERAQREKAWRLASERQLADREAINAVWQRLFDLRQQLAVNAQKSDYRAYRWLELQRFAYTPEDCLAFQKAIEETVVPAAKRIYERRRQRLGVDTLRPWDLDVDPLNRPPLQPFQDSPELKSKVNAIFQSVDPQLGGYFKTMIDENLLDLDNRKGKAPGGYCTSFPITKRPFIFMNSVGLHDDVQTMLHEGGHAFHVFETNHLTYRQHTSVPMEFAEVASMSMELLAAPYLEERFGGFYDTRDAARARIEHLENVILFWPYMAVVDGFQHWAYTHPQDAVHPAACDAAWGDLWDRFMAGVDWSGLEDARVTGWHRKLHIFNYPFYYVEYGLAQLGAVQVWRNALQDQAKAVSSYRKALSLGGKVPLPELFQAAGARLAFDSATLGEAVTLAEKVITDLEG